ncbi:MAG: response regulator [Treponema sp.]|jgi:PAS domain S-box-containing protein|nr:response regulator [Treponema sp.]
MDKNRTSLEYEYDLMKYRLTSDALGIAHWDMDVVDGDPINPNNQFTWSQEFRDMLRFNDEHDFPNILSSWSDRLHPEDKERTLNAFEAHIIDRTGKTPYDLEYRLLLKNGEYRWFRAFGTTLRNETGIPIRVAGALMDIEEEKQTKNQLLIMSSIVHNSPHSITYKKISGECLYINPAASTMSGHTREELMKDYVGLLFSETEPNASKMIAEGLRKDGYMQYELTAKLKNDEKRILAGTSFMVDSGSFATIVSDVTEMRKHEREKIEAMNELESALKQAKAASKAKGDFLSNMSHEMRTPMNAIIGMTAIGKNAKDIEQKNHALNKIGDASSHLLGVINDVLDMAKIEADKLELSPIEYCFERMLQKVVTVISFRVDEKRQRLSVNIDKNIPRFVVGDDQRLAQVITNLLANAVKFTPEEGSVHLEASFIGETSDLRSVDHGSGGVCELRIEVTDSGIGIAPEQHDKVFKPFEQAESGISRKFGGTGLGLVISKRIIELMDGNIHLESELGKGTKFIFTIKVGRGKKSPGSLLAPNVNWKNIRILVVDDMIETCNQFKDIFGNLGIQCDVASDGQEAWNIIEKRGEYDIYFIDWRMPVMDGIELTRLIKSRKGSRPSVVTMITAADWEQIKDEAIEAGVDKCLLKPLFSSMLIDCVNECLGVDQNKDEDIAIGEGEFAGKRLLVAEDIEINREILIALLENTGLVIDCAENGKEALIMITTDPEKYDVVFMDVQMPEMDGLEATRCIRALPGHRREKLPIIAMTANVFKSDIDDCLTAGMDAHLGKPLDIDDVLEKLRKYLRR